MRNAAFVERSKEKIREKIMKNRWFAIATCFLLAGCATDTKRDENDDGQFSWDNIAWQLEHFVEPNGEIVGAIDGSRIDAAFAKGQITGSGGCNRYFGEITVSGGSMMAISPVGSTMMACSEAIDEQERRYFDSLAEVGGYRYDEEAQLLSLSNREGKVIMVFRAKNPLLLEQTEWQATGINNGKAGIVSDKNTRLATAIFANGTVHGKAGCNRFSADYSKQNNALNIGIARTTRMFCAEAGVMELESNYLKALARAARFEVDGERLRLFDKDGALLVGFTRK